MINNSLLSSTRRITHQFTSVAGRNTGLLLACQVRTGTGAWKDQCCGTSLADGPNRKKTTQVLSKLGFSVHQSKTSEPLIYLPYEIFEVAYSKIVPSQSLLRAAKYLKGLIF